MPGQNLKYADEFAREYDNSILNNNWNGPQVIFNLSHKLLKAESRILDLGIGTGESSKRFKNVGHKITGLDGSAKMLDQCRRKNIASELVLHNVENTPFPVKDKEFDAVISNGLFHLIFPISPVFSEVKEKLKSKGLFVFTYENTHDVSESTEIKQGIWERKTNSGVYTYKYSDTLIADLLMSNKFELINEKRFLAFTNQQLQKNIYFTAIVAQLQQNNF